MRMVRSVLLALVLLLGAAVRAQDSTLMARADTLLAHGQWKAAKKAYEKAIAAGDTSMKALYDRTYCEYMLGEPREVVIGHLTEILRIDPHHYKALVLRADRYEDNMMYERAIMDLNEAIAVAKDTVQLVYCYNERGYAQYRIRSFAPALDDLNRAIALDSTGCTALGRMANVFDEMGRFNEAIAWQKRFITCSPDEYSGYLNVGFYLAQQGAFTEAMAWYEKAFAHGGERATELWNDRGYAKFRSGDLDGALKDIRKSLELMSWNSYAYRNLALVYIAQGRNDDACTALEKAISWGFTKQYGDEVKQLYDAHCK